MAEAKAWVMMLKLDKDKTRPVLETHPLILCEDCKHWEPERDGYCPYNHIYTVPDFFCADGEHKETEGEA